MSKAIDAKDKTIRQVMSGVQYSIDFYQRDYKWEKKQVEELIEDLTNRFLEHYQETHVRSDVASYPSYFLGSIVLSKRSEGIFIVDGQQRLTTLTLLMIFLRRLQLDGSTQEDPNVQQLIQSTQFGVKSFNMAVPERQKIIESLYNDVEVAKDLDDPSSANICARFEDIEEIFPERCKGPVLPFFMDWLVERVQLVEISAYSDDDAYTVFETMNDRGLSLSPADMLKGYLLSNIRDSEQRAASEESWNEALRQIGALPSKESTNDFFRSWFRGRFASSVGTTGDDYERLGPEFHRWLRDNAARLGLTHSDDFAEFVGEQVPQYATVYRSLRNNQVSFEEGEEALYYIGETRVDDFLLLMSAIAPDDSSDTHKLKLRVVANFLDIFINRRIWANRNISRPALKGTFVPLAKDLRDLSLEQLTVRLYAELTKPGPDDFSASPPALTGSTKRRLHRLLARLTSHLESQAGSGQCPYPELVVVSGRSRFDIEHIWPNQYDDYADEFADQADFDDYRNRLGSLLLIPHAYNASYSDMDANEKLRLYGRSDHHLLVASLAKATYERNPRFLKWIDETKMDFKPYDEVGFSKEASDSRLELYRAMARDIWSPSHLADASGLPQDRIAEQAVELYPEIVSEEGARERSRREHKVSLFDLVQSGLLEPSSVLVGTKPGIETSATAIVLSDGSLELENGERFNAPSSAAMALGISGVINGWKFWIHSSSEQTLYDIREQYLATTAGSAAAEI